MTIKQQLIQEIERIPEDIAVQLFNFLHLLQSSDRPSASATDTDESPFVCIDGFLVIKTQEPLPDVDWVSLMREERINDLMDYESTVYPENRNTIVEAIALPSETNLLSSSSPRFHIRSDIITHSILTFNF